MSRSEARLEAIEEVYRLQFVRFQRVATAIVGDRQRALDAVHDAFARAIRSRRRFRGDGPLEAWIWRAVVNEALRARREPTPDELPPEFADEPARDADHGDLAVAVAALPPRQRLAVFLRYYADLDYRTIAVALGIETGTVSATLHAAHASLRRTLEEVPT